MATITEISDDISEEKKAAAIESIDDEEDFEDESLAERLWGLTEMFPQRLRNGIGASKDLSIRSAKWTFGFGKRGLQILTQSFLILVFPATFVITQHRVEQRSVQQQKDMLLGPAAGMGGLGMMPQPPKAY